MPGGRSAKDTQEFVDHARCRYPGRSAGASSFDGITDHGTTRYVKGNDTRNIQQLNEQERYSRIKALRAGGHHHGSRPACPNVHRAVSQRGCRPTIGVVIRLMSALKLLPLRYQSRLAVFYAARTKRNGPSVSCGIFSGGLR